MLQAGNWITRPLSTTLHGQKPPEVLHLNFLYMGSADGRNLKYVMLLKDNLSAYAWLLAYVNLDSEASIDGLSK